MARVRTLAIVFERFTERGRRVMVLAQEEARLLGHNFIGTEHLLLGLIHEGECVAAQVLERLGISRETVRAKIEETVGAPATAAGGSPPFTPRAKRVLELSLREALQLGHNYIGTEHILLGIIREGEGVGARILVDLGADLPTVRQQVVQLLSGYTGREPVPEDDAPVLRSPAGRVFPSRTSPSGSPPDCPHCRAALEGSARLRRLEVVDDAGGATRAFAVVFCTACGRSLAFNPAD
jgi:ATP-dependent Clp protease ATP-binding subunit ClpA